MRRVLLLLISLVCIARPGVGTCGPVLNEIMADPNRDWDGDGAYSSKNDEWLEIFNPGPGSISLNEYLLTDELGKPVFGFSGDLASGGLAVIYGSQAVTWESSHGQPITGLRLGNDGDTVLLKQVTGGDTLTVDAYTYNTYEAENDRSSGRWPDGSANWSLFDSLDPYTGTTPPLGNGLPPTPGASNGGSGGPISPVIEVPWGRIKSLYVP